MYRQEELSLVDKNCYQYLLDNCGIQSRLKQAEHDFSMTDALYDYLQKKPVVGIMGGHVLSMYPSPKINISLIPNRTRQ